jgi:hypothetical protein
MRRGPLQAGLTALGATMHANHASLVVDGRALEVRFVDEVKYTVTCASVDVRATGARVGAPATLRAILLREEGANDQIGKSLGLNREVSVGDPAFDDAVYIESAAPDADVRAVLREPVRARVTALLPTTQRLVLYEGPFVARVFFDAIDEELASAAGIEARCRAALALADALPFDQEIAESTPRRGHRLAVAATSASMVVLGAVLWSDAEKVLPGEPSVYGFALGLAVTSALAAIAAWWVRGRADSFRVALEIAVPLVVCGSLFGAVGLPALNVRLDGSAGEVRTLRVERSIVNRPSKGAPTLHVRLTWTTSELRALQITMPPENAALFAVGTPCRARLHPGRFGWRWWEDLSRIDPEPAASGPVP